jgi:hypothetical protein
MKTQLCIFATAAAVMYIIWAIKMIKDYDKIRK